MTPIGKRGLLGVTTAEHGGIYVPDELLNRMPGALRCNVYGGGNWFEEDCEWALVVLAYPAEFTKPEVLEAAERTIEAYAGRAPYGAAALWLKAQRELAAGAETVHEATVAVLIGGAA